MKVFKNSFYILLLLISIVLLSSCETLRTKEIDGSGEYETQTYQDLIGNEISIEDIYLSKQKTGKPTVNFIESLDKKIIVTAQKNILNNIKVNSKTNEITIEGGETSFYLTDYITIDIYGYNFKSIELEHCDAIIAGSTFSDQSSIELTDKSSVVINDLVTNNFDIEESGSSSLEINNITTESLEVEVSGISSMTIHNLVATNTEFEISGTSNLEIDGKVTNVNMEVSSSSSINGESFEIDNCDISMTGKSTGSLKINTTLKYELSGESILNYLGEIKPTGKVSGGSKINKIEK